LSLVGAGGFLAATSRARADVDIGDDFGASRRRVVVVGAGVAGLSAAKALQNLGLEVVVLEGQDRLGGRLHFAGEAIHRRYHATMHGAMLSGLREAGRILGRDVTVADLV